MKLKTYQDIIEIIENSEPSDRLSVAVFFSGDLTWLPVDKEEYVRQIRMKDDPAKYNFPGWLQVENDGEMFIHPNVQPVDFTPLAI